MSRRLLQNLVFVILIFAVFCFCACGGSENESADSSIADASSEESGPEAVAAGILYYNIDGELYNAKADDSLTSREKNLDDGYFYITLSSEEGITELRAKSRILTNKIDSNPVLTLNVEDGIITEAFSIEEAGGSIAARRCFVASVSGNELTVNTNNTYSGDEIKLTLSDSVKIFDVSDSEKDFGAVTTLAEMDEVMAAAGSDGTVTHIWVLSRAGQNKGRGCCICGASETGESHKEGCDGTILYYWKPWTNRNALPTEGGYWYLDVDGGELFIEENVKLRSKMEIYLDLNGHTVYGPDKTAGMVAFYAVPDPSVAVSVTILDSKGTGLFKLRNPLDDDGTLSMHLMSRFMVFVGEKSSLTIYGGTIDGSELDGVGGNGALIRMTTGAVLNIHGGKIIGCRGTCNTGGAVFCSGTMNMTGGVITGGHAKKGGNVFIGTYEDNGYTKYGNFNMTGGEIKNGTATLSGGNLCYYEDGSCSITGGTITGGKAPEAEDVYMYPKFDPAA